MAYKVIIKKRFVNRLKAVHHYLEHTWGKKVADDFLDIVDSKVMMLQVYPLLGAATNLKDIRSYHITKHNRLLYRVLNDAIVIIALDDTRKKGYQSGSR